MTLAMVRAATLSLAVGVIETIGNTLNKGLLEWKGALICGVSGEEPLLKMQLKVSSFYSGALVN